MPNEVEFIADFELDEVAQVEGILNINKLVEQAMNNPDTFDWEKELRNMRCIIVDIDGTLSNIDHRLHHVLGMKPNWEKFFGELGKDKPHEEIQRLVQIYSQTGFVVYLVSARPEDYRLQTEAWLEKHNVPFDFLFMRKKGDYRPDPIVKKEILDREFKDKSIIEFVVDDRPQVVEMWRENGLRVLAVNPHPENVRKTKQS